MGWTPEFPNPICVEAGHPECRYFMAWLFSNECHAGCPYCMMGTALTKWYPRQWSDAQAIRAWDQFADDHGSAVILFGGHESGEHLPLVGRVVEDHWGIMVTNFTFDERVFCRLIPPGRMILHPSFHAHLWGNEIEEFLAKIQRFRNRGYWVPVVSMACWPPLMDRLPAWREQILAAGLSANIHPLYNTSYQGRVLPDGYTPDELQQVKALVPPCTYEDRIVRAPLKLKACAAGHTAGGITCDGSFARCVQRTRAMGNFMGGDHVVFDEEPRPCDVAQCMCGNMGGYQIHEEAEETA